MYDLTLQGLTTETVMAMGDGLAAKGHYDQAKGLYAYGLAREPNRRLRFRLRQRIGIVSAVSRRTPTMLQLLKTLEDKHDEVFVGEGMATWLKTVPFLDDERFLEIEARHAELLPAANWHWNLQVVLWALQQTREVPGDHVEMGVFKGHTTLFAADYVDFQDWPKRWVLFDTFDGIPDDMVDPGWEGVNQSVYKDTYSYDEVAARFARFPNIEVVQGRVPEILEGRCPDRIAFLHIDLNNTTAELAALEFVIDRLSPGAVLILDDYTWATARAQFKAERRWFGERGLTVLPLPTGQGVFVKR